MRYSCFLFLLISLCCVSCKNSQKETQAANGAFTETESAAEAGHYDLDEIRQTGELIVGTLSGPDTYFDYQGEPMGREYFLAEHFSSQSGLRLRMEQATDSAELLKMLEGGDIDVVAYPISQSDAKQGGVLAAGVRNDARKTNWVVRKSSPELAKALNDWFADRPDTLFVRRPVRNGKQRLAVGHVRAPFLSREHGVISQYDNLFREASRQTGWDWRLIAAQCYQESGFDPSARSWAGAQGLMQLMPRTAERMQVTDVYNPEQNVAGAARYIRLLQSSFSDIRATSERTKFVLAAYNGGAAHVRDAMALAEKHGRNPHLWEHVSFYVRGLSSPQFYRDPVVKNGYMIGEETSNYVSSIMERWRAYGGNPGSHSSGGDGQPSPAARPNKFTKGTQVLNKSELESQARDAEE